MKDQAEQIKLLIAKAAEAHSAAEALHFSQAACNAANALCALRSAEGA
ncbi:hypothetical protein CLV77_1435 [Brevirhabdus pacifica]|nr:hypothetical protein [Brevirhabdus pacifica]PJJ86875.1 hypothetical protein CLV77_1435 [Brevirhabdus pacifica]